MDRHARQTGGRLGNRPLRRFGPAGDRDIGKPREGADFFPLSVDFEERLYAAGRIPGSFQRRESRPSDQAILTSRLIDRPLRPLFPKGFLNEVQVIVTALARDPELHLDIMGIIAASAAVTISDIPWEGPIGAVRVGFIDGAFVINPTVEQMNSSTLDLRMAGTKDAILMVEAGADELPEDLMLEALRTGPRGDAAHHRAAGEDARRDRQAEVRVHAHPARCRRIQKPSRAGSATA